LKIDLKRKNKTKEKNDAGTVIDFSAGASADHSAGFSAGASAEEPAKERKKSRGLKNLDLGQKLKERKPQLKDRKPRGTSGEDRSGLISPMTKGPVRPAEDASDFAASVRSSEPILKVTDSSKKALWKKDVSLNIASAAVITAAAAFFCFIIDQPSLILCCLPCFAVFMLITTLESVKPGRAKWIAAAAIAIILAATGIIWRSTVFGGFAMQLDSFYTVAEEAQAYIYQRPPISISDSETAGYVGMAWVTALIGLLTALPPAGMRRGVCVLVTGIVMLAFAYYGLLPSAICIAVLAAAFMTASSRGGILPALPVIAIVLILFGAVILIDPGENYALSNADENFRDRFALRSALIESEFGTDNSLDQTESSATDESENETDTGTVFDGEYGPVAAIAVFILIAAAIGALVYLIHKRLEKRRAANRKGIYSKDAREAVVAMFPYTVKWLRGYGVEQTDAAVTSMIPGLRREYSDEYSRQFGEMYTVWSEAAYSDHEVSEDARLTMQKFMNETIKKTKEKCKLKDTLRLRFRHAL